MLVTKVQKVAVAKAGESQRKTVMSGIRKRADKTRWTTFLCSQCVVAATFVLKSLEEDATGSNEVSLVVVEW